MLRSNYRNELTSLNDDIIKMCSLVEDMIGRSVALFSKKDDVEARDIVESDEVINKMEKDVELRCIDLFMSQQPVAKDLRTISAAMKMITDMERIADHAGDIAAISMAMEKNTLIEVCPSLEKMATLSMEMLATSISAYVNLSTHVAQKVISLDDELDAMFEKVKKELVDDIRNVADDPLEILNALMAAKYLERIGDHSVNIGEWVIFALTGNLNLDN